MNKKDAPCATRYTSPNIVFGVDLETYRPVHPQTHYGSFSIAPNGSCRPTAPLPSSIVSFLEQTQQTASAWDGTKGLYGRSYSSHRPRTDAITLEQAQSLRSQYIALNKRTVHSPHHDKLHKELERFTRTHGQLHQSVLEMQVTIERLQKHHDAVEIDEGESEAVQDIEDKILFLSDEFAELKKVERNLLTKIIQVEVEISESNTGVIHRIALLRRIFGEEPLRGGLLAEFCKNAEQIANEVNIADEEAMCTFRLLFQAKCFYIDAVSGKKNLYKVEAKVKAILENLQEAMNSLSRSPGDSKPRREGERGPDFRLRYVRRLWNTVDADFKAALPYIEQTSFIQASKELHSVVRPSEGPNLSSNSFSRLGSSARLSGSPQANSFPLLSRQLSRKSSSQNRPSSFTPQPSNPSHPFNPSPQRKSLLRGLIPLSPQVSMSRASRKLSSNDHSTIPFSPASIPSMPFSPQSRSSQMPSRISSKNGRPPNPLSPSCSQSRNASLIPAVQSDSVEVRKTSSFGRQFSLTSISTRTHSLFIPGSQALPSYKKIELSHALSKKSRVAALHRHAVHAYRELNCMYDCQEEIVRQAFALVQKRSQEDSYATATLVKKWEGLLGI